MSPSSITILPNPSMMDQDDVQITLTNLRPGQHVTLQALIKKRKTIFYSHAHFVASLSGTINVASDNSFGGSYTGVSPMGIFWSMQPVDKKGVFKAARYLPISDRQSFILKMYDGHLDADNLHEYQIVDTKPDCLLGEAIAHRDFMSKGVTKHEVNHGRVRGILFKPKGNGPFKGVIDIYGGNGSIVEPRAALLASHGFVTLTLPYFKYKDLPKTLLSVELEYFVEAIEYFSSLEYVQPGISLVGLSFGGGISLFLSTVKNINLRSVVVIGSPHYIQIPMRWQGQQYPDSCWHRLTSGNPDPTLDEYGAMDGCTLIYDERCKETTFKLEESSPHLKYLFIVGEEDGNLRAEKSFQVLKKRMMEHGRGHQMQALVYPRTGHFVDPPHMPQTIFGLYFPGFGIVMRAGGTVQENNGACRHSWTNILKFLRENTGTVSSKL